MKLIIGIMALVLVSGCASNSRVDTLATQVQSNRLAVIELQKQNYQQETTIINLYSRIAGNEARIANLNERLNATNSDVANLTSKFDSKFKQTIMK